MNQTMVLLILGTAAVTYLPRALPSVVMDRLSLSPRVETFLQMIPYTAMAALIFPGVLVADPGRYDIGLFGGMVAGILAWKRVPVILCVLAAILADMLLYTLG